MKITGVRDIHKQYLMNLWIQEFDKWLDVNGFNRDDVNFDISFEDSIVNPISLNLSYTSNKDCLCVFYMYQGDLEKIMNEFKSTTLESFKKLISNYKIPIPVIKEKPVRIYKIRVGETLIDKTEDQLLPDDDIFKIENDFSISIEEAKNKIKGKNKS